MAFEFTWQFTFSDGEKVVVRGDYIKSHENSADGDFVRLISKCFTDTLNGVIGNRKDLAKWISEEGVSVKKPFMVFPPKPEPEKAEIIFPKGTNVILGGSRVGKTAKAKKVK